MMRNSLYIHDAARKAVKACETAVESLEPFRLRAAQGALPKIGSERHTGQKPEYA